MIRKVGIFLTMSGLSLVSLNNSMIGLAIALIGLIIMVKQEVALSSILILYVIYIVLLVVYIVVIQGAPPNLDSWIFIAYSVKEIIFISIVGWYVSIIRKIHSNKYIEGNRYLSKFNLFLFAEIAKLVVYSFILNINFNEGLLTGVMFICNALPIVALVFIGMEQIMCEKLIVKSSSMSGYSNYKHIQKHALKGKK